ncbi:MAG: hypothetical protein IIZ56_06540, partial [Clostridia bacterium]|nr:hypothetical protein [Clostridia bacterium]
ARATFPAAGEGSGRRQPKGFPSAGKLREAVRRGYNGRFPARGNRPFERICRFCEAKLPPSRGKGKFEDENAKHFHWFYRLNEFAVFAKQNCRLPAAKGNSRTKEP